MAGVAGWLADLERQLADVGVDVSSEWLLVAAAIVVAVLVVGGWYLYQRRRPKAVRFARLLSDVDEVAVLLHPNPDPDAMAAGSAVAEIAKSVGASPMLVYPGQLRHHENRAFRTVLNMDLDRIEGVADLGNRAVVLVDHGRPRGFTGADSVNPVAVIDHHDDPPITAPYIDVRPEYGACSTILVEYLRDLDATTDPGEGEVHLSEALATALIYGIHTDTNFLTRGSTDKEFEAVRYLYPLVDERALDRISNPPVEADLLDTKAKAIENRDVRDCYCVSDMGPIDAVDSVPIAAEELLRLEGVSAVIAIGERNGELHVSGRSIDDRVHMGKALERAVGVFPGASAGGHARMGAGQIPTFAMEGIGPTTGMTREEFVESLFQHLRETA